MNPTHVCPQCHSPLPPNAPQGLCPQCLLKAAASTLPGDLIDIGDPAEVAKCLPQFEIIEMLGRGGMGVVYKARQRQLDRLVALKILPPTEALSADFVSRFSREARSLAKLTHANIVAIYDFGESNGLYYFSMEYVDGVNLRSLIADGKMAPTQALAIVPLVCDALAYAHEEGVVHRDIKPENILIDKKGRVKIADFGLAKLLRRESLDLTLTAAGTALGTLRYMAPEQMDRPETVDHRADIYSLGVVFYEMLTGDVPMGRFAPPSQQPGVDARLDEIVMHALDRNPDHRYQNASEVKTDVENVSGLIERLPPAMRAQFGFDYRSAKTFFGLPLLHVATGVDPSTGKPRTAKGIVAIGGRAVGVFAFGGVAAGVVAFGGLATGGLAMGGLSVGIFSMGGIALALFFAYGGMGIAPFALGGVAIGYIASGGIAFGAHTASGLGSDRIGAEFFRKWNNRSMLIFYVLFTIALAGQTAGKLFAKHSLSATKGSASPAKPARRHLLTAFLTLLSIAAFFFGANFRATTEMTPAGRTSTTTVGSFDPLFTYEGGPSGFHYGFQFFSWSFFALIICGVSFAALLRVSREDEGKVARDPDWWRDWWKQVGIWCGLLFLACAVRTAMKSRAPASIAPMTEGANISPPQSTGRVDADVKP